MKKYLPFVIGAIAVFGGLYLLFMQQQAAPATGPVVATSTDSELSSGNDVAGEPSIQVGSAPQKIVVDSKSVFRVFDNPKWHFVFETPAEWKLGLVNAADGDVEQITYSTADGSNVFVGKQSRIAEPARAKYSVSTRTIAGQKVEVHRYLKPNEQYAYYLFFTLVSGNYEYYVSIRSIDASDAFADAFLNGITAK